MAPPLSRTDRHRVLTGLLLYAVLFSPPVLRLLESRMVSHVALLLPALASAGWLCGSAFRGRTDFLNERWNAAGLPGLLAALFAATFWMLPRVLDESLAGLAAEIGKLTGVPLLVGVALSLSWGPAGPLLRGVLKVNLISMLVVLGWLYTIAPVRFCTSYLQTDQQQLGQIFLGLAGALGLLWSLPWFFTGSREAGAAKLRCLSGDVAVASKSPIG